MNDTEAEARHLLAVATEDRPPGIDLLAGFDAARRRDRARRIRGRAAVVAAATAAAAAAAVTLVASPGQPALATVTQAVTHTLGQSYRARENYGSYYVRSGGRIALPVHGTCTAEADPARHRQSLSCSNGFAKRSVGRYTYWHIAHFSGHPGKHWVRLTSLSLPGWFDLNDFISAAPQQMLAQIKKANQVRVIGPVSGTGWRGTRYSYSASSGATGRHGMVDVDQQGRVRAVTLTVRSRSRSETFVTTQATTFSGFGRPVHITAPPASQTVTSPVG